MKQQVTELKEFLKTNGNPYTPPKPIHLKWSHLKFDTVQVTKIYTSYDTVWIEQRDGLTDAETVYDWVLDELIRLLRFYSHEEKKPKYDRFKNSKLFKK